MRLRTAVNDLMRLQLLCGCYGGGHEVNVWTDDVD